MKQKEFSEQEHLFIRHYKKRVKNIDNFVKLYPSLKKKPVGSKLIVCLVSLIALLTPILFMDFNFRNISSEVYSYNLIAVYVPIILAIFGFYLNQNYLIPKYIIKKQILKYVLVNALILILIFSLRNICLEVLENHIFSINIQSFHDFKPPTHKDLIIKLGAFVIINILACLINVGIFFYTAQIQYFIQEYSNEQMRLKNQLSYFKTQISPHFLFNTINNVVTMMSIDTNLAKKIMMHLSEILRTILYETKIEYISVGKEIEFLKNFIEIETLHFYNNIDFEMHTEIENESREIVPLLLLPLIENMFKHGNNLKGKSFFRISITEKAGELIYESVNLNFPRKSSKNQSGIGLSNFNNCLEVLYPNQYEYKTSLENNFYKVYLKIPLREKPQSN